MNVKWSRISSCHVLGKEMAHVNDKAADREGKLRVSVMDMVLDMG